MRKPMVRILACVLMLCLAAALAPVSFADAFQMPEPESGSAPEMLLGSNYEELFRPNEAPRQWSLSPEQTGEYLLFTKTDAIILAEIAGVAPVSTQDLPTGQRYQVYALTAGQTYTVQAYLNPAFYSQYPNGYKDTVCVERKQPLQSLQMLSTEYTGARGDFGTLYVEADPSYYPLDNIQWSSSDSNIVKIESADQRECFIRLMNVGTATVTASLDGKSVSCTVTVEKATGEWDNYEVWPAGQTQKNVTLSDGVGIPYSFTPAESGKYVMYVKSGDVHMYCRATNDLVQTQETMIHTENVTYSIVELIAGETYVIAVAVNPGNTAVIHATACLEPARDVDSVTVYCPNKTDSSHITGYVGGSVSLYSVTSPAYSYGLCKEGFVYTSSDPNVAVVSNLGDPGGQGGELMLVGPGTCTVTVTIGGKTAACQVTVSASPVLQAGSSTTLTLSGQVYGVTCLFTPERSGTYTFSIQGTGGTCHIEDTNIGTYFENYGYMSGYLTAGKTYRVILYVGGSDHTVTVSGSTSGGTTGGPEEGPAPGTQETEPAPSSPADPTEPVQTPDATAPSVPDPTEPPPSEAPSAPAEDIDAIVQALGGSFENGTVTLTLQSDSSLTAQTLQSLAQSGVSLQLQAADFRIVLDNAALSAIADQAAGAVTLQCRQVGQQALSNEQKAAVEGQSLAAAISVSLQCSDADIHDFGNGTATVRLPFQPETGRAGTDHQVYYLSPAGSLEKMESTYANGYISFQTSHFSEYVILYEAAQPAPLGWIIGVAAAIVLLGGIGAILLLRKKKAA